MTSSSLEPKKPFVEKKMKAKEAKQEAPKAVKSVQKTQMKPKIESQRPEVEPARRSSRVRSKTDKVEEEKKDLSREEKLNLIELFVAELRNVFKCENIRKDKAKEMLKRKEWDVAYAIFTVKKNYPFYTKFFGIENSAAPQKSL